MVCALVTRNLKPTPLLSPEPGTDFLWAYIGTPLGSSGTLPASGLHISIFRCLVVGNGRMDPCSSPYYKNLGSSGLGLKGLRFRG